MDTFAGLGVFDVCGGNGLELMNIEYRIWNKAFLMLKFVPKVVIYDTWKLDIPCWVLHTQNFTTIQLHFL
jgi:hypothetical protein